jgi:hypothetical protein
MYVEQDRSMYNQMDIIIVIIVQISIVVQVAINRRDQRLMLVQMRLQVVALILVDDVVQRIIR